jgi:signal transduction histidine kinase
MMMPGMPGGMMDSSDMQGRDRLQSQIQADIPAQQPQAQQFTQQQQQGDFDTETVQIRIEPFMTIVTPGDDGQPLFPGQVFLLRHIQIEQKHFLQGFRLDEAELIRQVEDSAWRFKRRDMDFDIGCEENPNAAHTAILDFGFGDLVLNLLETDPGWITKQIAMLRNGYFAVVAVVFIAVTLAQIGLWRTASAQIKLARKKDDFISAVSHELRTPLTTIRMYTEMLEKNWVKTDEKRSEYYTTMRQESERLTRLIENVLDFSRIQRGRKKYHFKIGDINTCVSDVVDMMAPCAAGAGFIVEKDFAHIDPFTFDPDAVMQIVINLLDNAIKYAGNAEDKIIIIRTRPTDGFILIEVEDHGPGIGHLQRKKVFEEFYRTASEATRETTGTGLGLALVKKFAQAHQGFVEILGAKPSGAILRVALTTKP